MIRKTDDEEAGCEAVAAALIVTLAEELRRSRGAGKRETERSEAGYSITRYQSTRGRAVTCFACKSITRDGGISSSTRQDESLFRVCVRVSHIPCLSPSFPPPFPLPPIHRRVTLRRESSMLGAPRLSLTDGNETRLPQPASSTKPMCLSVTTCAPSEAASPYDKERERSTRFIY